MTAVASTLQLEEPIAAAVEDLEQRTLASIPGVIARLVYLGSLRDFNSGDYQHEGFVYRHGRVAAAAALTICHRQVFQDVLLLPMADLTREIETYFQTTESPAKTMMAWRRLKAFQLLTPVPCDPVSENLFTSKVQLALGVLVVRGVFPE